MAVHDLFGGRLVSRGARPDLAAVVLAPGVHLTFSCQGQAILNLMVLTQNLTVFNFDLKFHCILLKCGRFSFEI